MPDGTERLAQDGSAEREPDASEKSMAANSEEICILGCLFLKLSGINMDGRVFTSKVMVYVSDSTSKFYLSRSALVDLGVIGVAFPQVGRRALRRQWMQQFDHNPRCQTLAWISRSQSLLRHNQRSETLVVLDQCLLR